MQTLTIQTNADHTTLDAIKTLLLSIDPKTVFTYKNNYSLSPADEKEFLQRIERYEAGELETASLEDAKKHSQKHLRKLGA